MSLKGGRANLRRVDEWDRGVGWIAYPSEALCRASHAVVIDGEVWVLDPVDVHGVHDLLADLGDVAGTVVCFDRHKRAAATVAERHDVPVYVHERMRGVETAIESRAVDIEVERFGDQLAEEIEVIPVRFSGLPQWQEIALAVDGALYVPESVGTAVHYLAPGDRLGVHPMLRPVPPRETLGDRSPERLLCGHGEGVHDDAEEALSTALSTARRRALNAYGSALRAFVGGG